MKDEADRVAEPTSPPATKQTERVACPSCSRMIQTPHCPYCGCPAAVKRLTLPGLAREFWRQSIEIDGPILRTIIALMWQPHVVAQAYINGDRRRFLNPARFCFVAGATIVIMFGLFGVNVVRLMSDAGMIRVSGDSASQDVELFDRLMSASESTQQYIHIFTLAVLPCAAVLLKLLFRKRQLTLAEHLTILLFVYGEVFLVQAVSVPLGAYSSATSMWIVTLVLQVYIMWGIVKFYQAPIITGLLRAFFVTVSILILSQLLLLGLSIAMAIIGATRGAA